MIEKVDHFGKGAPRLKHVGAVKQALAMNRASEICDNCGEGWSIAKLAGNLGKCPKCANDKFHRRRIFSLSLGDWLEKEIRRTWFSEMLYTVYQCNAVVWILCTKRTENWRELVASILTFDESKNDVGFRTWLSDWLIGIPPKNIILLASVENQEMSDKRIPQLLMIPAACRGLSLEPLLGPVDLDYQYHPDGKDSFGVHCPESWRIGHLPFSKKPIDWLIIGGESGTGARPCNFQWIRSLVAQGKSAGVATFVKQLGAKPFDSSCQMAFDLKDKKGGDLTEWPEDLKVREFPAL